MKLKTTHESKARVRLKTSFPYATQLTLSIGRQACFFGGSRIQGVLPSVRIALSFSLPSLSCFLDLCGVGGWKQALISIVHKLFKKSIVLHKCIALYSPLSRHPLK